MFFFRLNKAKIIDNRERGGLFNKKKGDKAEVQLLSFVTTEFTDLPNLDALLAATDEGVQKALLQQTVSTVISRRILTTIQNVKDNHTMYFGDTGFTLFYSEHLPDAIDVQICLIELDKKERDTVAWTESVIKSPQFGGFAKNLTTVLKSGAKVAGVAASIAGGPAFVASQAIGKFALDILLQSGKKNKDDQLGLLYLSLNRPEHYPHGKRDSQDVHDTTGNMTVDYTVFGVEDFMPPVAERPKALVGEKPKKSLSFF